jgi:hypothetical protein
MIRAAVPRPVPRTGQVTCWTGVLLDETEREKMAGNASGFDPLARGGLQFQDATLAAPGIAAGQPRREAATVSGTARPLPIDMRFDSGVPEE